jgi:membrane protein implicated in regulation of membrane protease activity
MQPCLRFRAFAGMKNQGAAVGELLSNPVNVWLAAGALIIALEAFTAPGLGFFLGGLGALCTALVIKSGLVGEASIGAQFAWCFGLTVAWAALLWKPLQKYRMRRKARNQEVKTNNLIGEVVTVAEGGLKRGEVGQVIWSGTVMNAELESPHAQDLPHGAKAQVHSVSGNILKVTAK